MGKLVSFAAFGNEQTEDPSGELRREGRGLGKEGGKTGVDEILWPDNVGKQDVVEVPTSVEKSAEEELSPEPEDSKSVCGERIRMGELSDSIREENVRELVCDRIEQVTRRLEDWGVEMADSLAELESLRSDDEFDEGQLKKICAELRRQLESLDCELIDLDEWDPEKQRAIRVEEGLPSGSTPSITRKVSLGLCVQGRLVRKQEVYIKK